MSAHCSPVVTCWERASLLALMYVMLSCIFVTFLRGVLFQVCYLIISIPDLCLLPCFEIQQLQSKLEATWAYTYVWNFFCLLI